MGDESRIDWLERLAKRVASGRVQPGSITGPRDGPLLQPKKTSPCDVL